MISISPDDSSFIRRVICFNQGEYAQYNFLAAERHKALKESWRKSHNAKALLGHCDELVSFLNTHLNRISQGNFAFIKEYFGGRHPVEPRICIKGNFRHNGRDYIVPLIRDKEVSYLSEYPLESNYGFIFVKNNGTHFRSDDIPKDIAEGTYHNARINHELATAYYKQRNQDPTLSDESWAKCWDPPTRHSSYKSTVIIPMTLWNNDLTQEFLTKMEIKAHKDTISRTVFGYLCFDHVKEHYFDDNADIDMGYIFADMLSLYMITVYIYTERSETFSSVLESLQQQKIA